MVDKIQFSLIGVDQLIAKLDTVTQDMKKKGGRFALRKAAKIVADRAKLNAAKLDDSSTGRSIADNIAIRWDGKTFKRTGNLGFRVGVLQGAILPGKGETPDKSASAATPHWRLLEFGTEHIAPTPFMLPAMTETIGAATDEFIKQYGKSLDRAIKRAGK